MFLVDVSMHAHHLSSSVFTRHNEAREQAASQRRGIQGFLVHVDPPRSPSVSPPRRSPQPSSSEIDSEAMTVNSLSSVSETK